jgi:transposase-like protein
MTAPTTAKPTGSACCGAPPAGFAPTFHTTRADTIVAKAEGRAQRTAAETDMAAKLKALERENRELRQANEILRKASAYFAQAELDRPSRP